MIKVKVTSFFTLKDLLGDCNVALSPEDCSVNALLKELVKIYGEKFSKQVLDSKTGEVKFYRVVLNNRQCDDFDAPLKDGDTIQFYPALAGG